jgi:hypothetical protein
MLTSIRGWLGFGALLIAIAAIEWIYVAIPPQAKPSRKAVESWALPPAPSAQPEKAMEILGKNNSLWGKLPELAASAPLTDPEWHFLGIVTNGPERFVLIKIAGQPEKSLRINDDLPGGSKIVNIEDDKICVLVNGKKRSLGIYKMGPQVL